jgi:hypothetical protein
MAVTIRVSPSLVVASLQHKGVLARRTVAMSLQLRGVDVR